MPARRLASMVAGTFDTNLFLVLARFSGGGRDVFVLVGDSRTAIFPSSLTHETFF